ncbi:MAG: cell wall-binding repeat-containing protein [Actinobacteria bacterium]|nr:cell wall-binding repeat-containing protein [Actinomycetota bacterium]
MHRRSVYVLVSVVFMLVVGVVAAGAATQTDAPSQQELAQYLQQSTWHQPVDYPDWQGPTSGGTQATDTARPEATIVSAIGSALTDGCGDASSGAADINTVDVELQDDGNWRFTVNLCAAHDLSDETGWKIDFATTAYHSDGDTSPTPVTTYTASITHEIEYYSLLAPYNGIYEPNAAVYYNDGSDLFVTGRPDGDTLSCTAHSTVLFGDPDRGYIGGVTAATGFTIDINPACFGSPDQAWLAVSGPGDSISYDGSSIHATFGQTARISGASRFDTAVQISRRAFPLGGRYGFGTWGAYLTPESYVMGATRVVYLTNGLNYPDALAASAFSSSMMAGQAGPVLFWNAVAGVVPDETLGEICRIQPGKIIALGGTLAVSDAALAEAQTAANSSDCLTDYGLAN